MGQPTPSTFTPRSRSTSMATIRRYALKVITCANMPPKVKVSGGSHRASTNVSSQALRLRTSVSTLWNARSAFSRRASHCRRGPVLRRGIVKQGRTAARQCRGPGFLGLHHPVQKLAQVPIGAIPGKYMYLVVQRAVQLFVVQRLRQIKKALRMPGLLAREDVKEIHESTCSFRIILTGTVVNSIRSVEASVRRPHAAIETRGNAEGITESPGERFQRSVIGVETDVCHRESGARQLPCRPFQQQPAAHGDRRLLDQRPEHTIKLCPASISVAGETARILLLIERIKNDFA